MRIAVFSDIHSNRTALEACVEYIDGHPVDGIIFLGDEISDCPNPQAVLDMLKGLDGRFPTWHIKGNREQYFLDHADGARDGWTYSSYKGSLLYTYEHLRQEDLDGFRRRKGTAVVSVEGTAPVTIAHGSPASLRELLLPGRENTKQYLRELKTDYLLCGHTHRQCCYSVDQKWFFNPGSIGVAIGRRATADFGIMEWSRGRWRFEGHSIPFDLERVRREFEQSSLMEKAYIWPKCILRSMETGVNMGPLCAKAAYEAAREEGCEASERHWREAARSLHII